MENPPERVDFSCYNNCMSKENEETLKIYDKYAKVYLETGIIHDQHDPEKAKNKKAKLEIFLKESFGPLPPRSKIFEIGSGDGENAEFLNSIDFRTIASDVAEDFIKAVENRGLECRKFNVLKDDFADKYDGALAWRVFVHFKKEDFALALQKIFNTLRPGGIFVFNVLNTIDHNNKESAWVDYEGDYHMGVERFFYYYKEEEADKIITNTGFEIQNKKHEGGDTGNRWIVYVVKKPTGVKKAIEKYVEREILPQYKKLSGHTTAHISQVIARSLAIVEDMPEINRDMVYVIAAYHDLGRLVDDDTHNIESGKMMAKDASLREFFSETELKTMIEAVEDHRASLKTDPRNIYGRIVGTADRDMDIDEMLSRSYDYTRLINPEMTDDEVIEEARLHLRDKFSPNGYGAKKMYFSTSEMKECFRKVEELTRDPLEYRKLMKDFNKRRGLKSA